MALSDIISKARSFRLFKTQGSVIGLDIGSSAIKVVELEERGGKIHLLKYGTLATGPLMRGDVGTVAKLSTEKSIEAIKITLEAIGVKSREGALSIPLKLSLIVTIDIPAVAESKLDSVVPIEARRYIPMPTSEVDIAWSVISSSDKGSLDEEKDKKNKKIKVLIAAIHNTTVDSYQEIATRSGIDPAIFEIETFSAIRSVFGNERGTFAMLDVGSEVSKVVVIDHGSITVSHSINRGSQAFTNAISKAFNITFHDAEKIKRKHGMIGARDGKQFGDVVASDVQYIIDEAKKVFDDFEKTSKKKIEKVVFIGGGSVLKGFTATASKALGRDVTLGNPFNNVELPTPVLAPVLKETGPEFAVAVGLAMRALSEL